ncbi:hypothetical protein [Saccharopolyspora sp. NPDC050642]|uniref:hypothetical protein n=1 Tax=Saccharopolyspora sp. NPDC050642 TaxID=3157099 RepID=UPI0033D5599C
MNTAPGMMMPPRTIDWKIHDEVRPVSLRARLSAASVAKHKLIAIALQASRSRVRAHVF